jgi:hypothetical protein
MLDPSLFCTYPAADAGKACSRSTDCSLECSASTHTCVAAQGMGEFLDENGETFEVVE